MVAPKTKRKDLAVPEYVAKEWTEGDKNGMADLLLRCNFSKEEFFNQILIIVKKKKSYQVVIDEGWHSESDLKELGWSGAKIAGAKSHCLALGESHARRNAYDGEMEFFVVVRETAKRTEESSYEHEQSKRMKAEHDPVNELGDDFAGLDARAKRETDIQTKKPDQQGLMNKYLQTKASLKTFMSSSLSKAGKLRLLVRDLKKGYTESATSTSIKTLESHIADMDKHYDACNDAWAKGEVENFSTEEWYKLAEQCMKDGTFANAKATAFETKIRTSQGKVCNFFAG
ncbi:unnamed protein product [Cladocopium goreaui]|uniref:Uncharacterized protein n=1 Tax=Cladocopium goreaui TaxID=2562237 RepID=A0A9P1DMU4_9DINO|nr:unnamed protein product [Cladocopium goreaui]CAI3997900.1 unnamed protein product [Cladocopium goreaui]CAI4009775.1 unnamed protein product [Cladocopium goreaui]CAI4013145.1 unnamed protein product [Cladocopium goreaui]